MSTFKLFNSQCPNCAAEKKVKALDFAPSKIHPNINVPFDNYRHGVHVLDHDISTFKKIGCEPAMKCIAQLVIPAGTIIVVPSSTAQIRTNGAFVANIECQQNGVFALLNEFNQCHSLYKPSFQYRAGSPAVSDLDVGDYEGGKGIHSFRTKEQAQLWELSYIKPSSNNKPS